MLYIIGAFEPVSNTALRLRAEHAFLILYLGTAFGRIESLPRPESGRDYATPDKTKAGARHNRSTCRRRTARSDRRHASVVRAANGDTRGTDRPDDGPKPKCRMTRFLSNMDMVLAKTGLVLAVGYAELAPDAASSQSGSSAGSRRNGYDPKSAQRDHRYTGAACRQSGAGSFDLTSFPHIAPLKHLRLN